MTEDYTVEPLELPPQKIEYFKITSLFGDRTIHVPFNSFASVVVSDNGVGKTTVLNAIYSILTYNVSRLSRINFKSISVKVVNIPEFTIYRDDLARRGSRFDKKYIYYLLRSAEQLAPSIRMELEHYIERNDTFNPRFRRLVEVVAENDVGARFDIDDMMHGLRMVEGGDRVKKKEKELKDFVTENLDMETLYFTTYRRVEEDIQAFGPIKEGVAGSNLINFGMVDVAKRFADITQSIRDTSAKQYSVISGQMLNQLVDEIETTPDMLERIRNSEEVKIVLSRTGGTVSDTTKESILNKINDGTIQSNRQLTYFLSKLMEVYIAQKDMDESIKKFVAVVNKYLVNKKVVYDEVTPEINIVDNKSERNINVSYLSSGEKQLISIMSRLYLERGTKPLAILFDEPELSLSAEWQKMFLPDMIASARCGFLLAATHSPFIFENWLDRYARDLVVEYEGEGRPE